jgi:hypothetical protein
MRDLEKIFTGALISSGTIGYIVGFIFGFLAGLIF